MAGLFSFLKGAVKGRSAQAAPQPRAAFFKGERSPFMVSWNPALREQQQDVAAAWQKSAARAVDAIQNSGFIRAAVRTSCGAVVGSGLQMSSRPDAAILGWSDSYASEWGTKAEALFKDWARRRQNCDAAERMNFRQMQQAAYASYMAYGEVVALTPVVDPDYPGQWATRLRLIPPSRIVDKSNQIDKMVNGVQVNDYGKAVGYMLRNRTESNVLPGQIPDEILVPALDRDGRQNVIHIFDPEVAVTRGISPLASILKVTRQIDQFADANLTKALIQTIFAAVMKTNVNNVTAFDGLMSEGDSLNIAALGEAKGEWYEGAKIDFTQHGRIAHLFPTDELSFLQANGQGAEFDHFMTWLLREVAQGAGITYEGLTGDYRGATYSSVRMAGAIEWLTVMQRRDNIAVPFAQTGYELALEEAIYTGRLEYPGGYPRFIEQRGAACVATWTGPPRPQADDYKTAKAYEVRKAMGATTLAEICADYGQDWDDVLRQQARERDLALSLGLPDPWRDEKAVQAADQVAADPGAAKGEVSDDAVQALDEETVAHLEKELEEE